MTVTIKINCDNAAFDDGAAGHEIARILEDAADCVRIDGAEPGYTMGLRDVNGNIVGRLTITGRREI